MQDFGVYVHVPFCVRRCGYCDFNTYTPHELRGGHSLVSEYPAQARREIELAAEYLGSLPGRDVATVFFGGGTPTVLPAAELVSILDKIRETWGLAPFAEVTTEANPDSVTPRSLTELAEGGFTRISLGMQSAVPHVLKTLDRTHGAGRISDVVQWARDAGLAVSLDLIYGTPGESLSDWARSVEAALATGIDHVSAYALTVVPGTRMYAQIQRGELPAPDDDDEAAKYELADEILTDNGMEWYEISNWARGGIDGSNVCRHNLGYWRGADWWGIGPGAHSHLGASTVDGFDAPRAIGEPRLDQPDGYERRNHRGRRWWNVKHPRRSAEMIAAGTLPIEGEETLTPAEMKLERIMLETRLADGLPLEALESSSAIPALIANGLIDEALDSNRLRLTRRGRLLADTVVRALTD